MEQKYLKLSEYANIHRIKYRAAWNRFKEGKIEGSFTDEFGKILIPIKKEESIQKKCVIYARVSSNDRKDSLKSQQQRLEEFAIANGYEIIKSVKEIASGMNDNRPKLNELIEMDGWNYLIVENKDRLTRFGFNYFRNLLKKSNKEIVVINTSENDNEDLIKDLISIIYSFSARMYGLRKRKNKRQIIDFLEKN
jgi:predicted site-specific integrase-resolvase